MEQFDILCTREQASQILKQSQLTKSDVDKIASVTQYTLVDALKNLSNAEIKEVHMIESKNVMFVINLFTGILSDNPWVLNKIENNSSYIQLCEAIEEEYKSESEVRLITLGMTVKYCLSNGNIKNLNYNGAFQGTIPKKMFSLRQITAENWFKDYVNFISNIASLIFSKTDDTDLVLHYVLLTTAYYLNKSQTYKYYKKSSDSSFEDTYYRIIMELIENQGCTSSEKTTIQGKILYKNL